MIRRETSRGVSITDDIGLRLDKPYSRTGAQFRPAFVREVLMQTDAGRAEYSVEVSGPVQTKGGRDSNASSGRVVYGSGFTTVGPVSQIPRRLTGYLVGPEILAKAIALPTGGAS